jgi:hypothetical protein
MRIDGDDDDEENEYELSDAKTQLLSCWLVLQEQCHEVRCARACFACVASTVAASSYLGAAVRMLVWRACIFPAGLHYSCIQLCVLLPLVNHASCSSCPAGCPADKDERKHHLRLQRQGLQQHQQYHTSRCCFHIISVCFLFLIIKSYLR